MGGGPSATSPKSPAFTAKNGRSPAPEKASFPLFASGRRSTPNSSGARGESSSSRSSSPLEAARPDPSSRRDQRLIRSRGRQTLLVRRARRPFLLGNSSPPRDRRLPRPQDLSRARCVGSAAIIGTSVRHSDLDLLHGRRSSQMPTAIPSRARICPTSRATSRIGLRLCKSCRAAFTDAVVDMRPSQQNWSCELRCRPRTRSLRVRKRNP